MDKNIAGLIFASTFLFIAIGAVVVVLIILSNIFYTIIIKDEELLNAIAETRNHIIALYVLLLPWVAILCVVSEVIYYSQ